MTKKEYLDHAAVLVAAAQKAVDALKAKPKPGHPPIPPGCEWFFDKLIDRNKSWRALLPSQTSAYYYVELDENVEVRERRIIASVARLAWLDEADGLDDASSSGMVLRTAAIHNSEAWKAWGEAKQ